MCTYIFSYVSTTMYDIRTYCSDSEVISTNVFIVFHMFLRNYLHYVQNLVYINFLCSDNANTNHVKTSRTR